ncbi:MAG: bifunctional riboflavin kinase/FAD synthetase [Candidatus Obscuribacter sp.]|nr:bifunctional riboflavin kinase/FAD synthetase [Candidatus Obscuribacter sp.]MBL0187633.1 bifunctional riboflavin kinase/FAD synthetase [Candidatus Obscuribacter sp.]MBP6351214.1 bifunctional riboflavin kinase/FAD synthetase [Candidatus Obscuribacter sp.]MBP7576654.1 bifunctional riboflavin kinase/FAD synthetase [Candidatus Obscuribacter sp.]
MDVFFDPKPGLIDRSAIALGFFDGVHPGHQAVIGKAIEEARRLNIPSGVVTFKDHPRGLTRGQAPLLLTVIEERLGLFKEMGVDVALVLTFSEELCRLTPQAYVEDMLVKAMGAKSISVGHNHHFGRDREGDASLLAKMGETLDFCVHTSEMVYVDGLEVSSSRVRDLVIGKNLELAAKLLSRPFSVRGEIVKGDQRGRTLGFPTANVHTAKNQLLPPCGVYAGFCEILGEGHGQKHLCVINIGVRPTFKNPEMRMDMANPEPKLTVEAHLLDFDRDIYGRELRVEFHKLLRDEKKFDGLESLKTQIALDCQMARSTMPCLIL